MQAQQRAVRERGFTLIEFLVVLAISAILLLVAVGGFGTTAARKRLEGVATEIATHLQQARSEAVSRNRFVRLTFGTDCLFVHTLTTAGTSTASCSGTTPPVPGAGEEVIARVGRSASDVSVTREPTATPVTHYQFDHLTGGMNVAVPAGHGIVVGSTAGPWLLRVRVNAAGRVELCTPATGPGTTMPGYATC